MNLQPANLELQKWRTTILVGFSKLLVYKLNFILQIIGPVVIFYFIKYNLWTKIYQSHPEEIKGYSLEEMLSYQSWMVIVIMVAQGYNSMSLSEEIRLGKISTYLIYPFSFWKHQTALFISFEVIQLVISFATLVFLFALGVIENISISSLLIGYLYCIVVSLFWFVTSFSIGLMAFWLDETWVLRVMFLLICQFLSGSVLPIDLYPDALLNILEWSPFPYLTYVPVKIFMGEYEHSTLFAVGILIFWTIIVSLIGRTIWNKGIKLYTAAGM